MKNPRVSSLVAQTVKHLSAMQETQVQPLGQEDPLAEEMETHSYILAWKITWTWSLEDYSPRGRNELDRSELLST